MRQEIIDKIAQGLSFEEVSRQLRVPYENIRAIHRVYVLENRMKRKSRTHIDSQTTIQLAQSPSTSHEQEEVKDFK